jgi:hypothetical protein
MYVKMTVTSTRGKNLLSTNQSNIIFQSPMTLHRKHKELLFVKCGFLASSEVGNKRSIWCVYGVCVCVYRVCVCVCDMACFVYEASINVHGSFRMSTEQRKRSLTLYRKESWWSIKASVSDLPVIALWKLSSCKIHVQECGQKTNRQVNRTTLNHLEGKMLENKLRLFLKHRKIATSQVGLLYCIYCIYC